MGRGTYLGGSTIIGPRSGWFSGIGQTSAVKLTTKTSSPNNKINAHRIHYLHAVARAEVAGETPPHLSKKAKNALQTIVTAAGGPAAWARAQPEYTKFRERAKRRREKDYKLSEQANHAPDSAAATAKHKSKENEVLQHLTYIRTTMLQVNNLMREIAERQNRLEILLQGHLSKTA